MAFPPPTSGNNILQAMMMGSGMAPQQYQMAGIMPIGMPGIPPPPHIIQQQSMGVTVPSGVTTISAPPVRKVTTNQPPPGPPPLLGMYPGAQPMFPGLQDPTQQRRPKPPPGSTITVFVGNITERASDMLIRQLLSKCGSVNNWKRVQGANGKLQAFGFCEYLDAESAMRAIRLLNDYEIADKKLVVKVDSKAQEKLDEYNKAKGVKSDELDEQTKHEDQIILSQIQGVLKEHEIELSREPDLKDRIRIFHNSKRDPTKPENLSEMEMEDDKRSLINREIDKFRDTYKRTEEKRDEDKKKKDETDKIKDEKDSRSRERSVESERSKTRSLRNRDRSVERERRREREREREKEREKERNRSRDYWSESRDDRNPIEDEEDDYERRRIERQLREKEASYQKRLRDWETREARKMKDYEREALKEENKRQEEEEESKKLKEFLEDYDDDRFDTKFYKGNAYTRRWRERQKEIEADERERELEKRELEDLRDRLAQEGHPDPESEAKKRMLTGDSERNAKINDKIGQFMMEARQKSGIRGEDDMNVCDGSPKEEVHVKSFGFAGMKLGANVASTEKQPEKQAVNSPDSNGIGPSAGGDAIKRKKFSVSDVFNANDDDDLASKNKKRKLPTLIDENTDSNLSSPSTRNAAGDSSKSSLSSDEKRKQAKAIIEKIPTSKDELFTYNIEWNLVDNVLMEKRIRPWINKKIAEYIGEEEQALLDFICTKLQTKSSAQSILDDVAMVLDEEAEVFVVKMWRLLIYEIEAKKLGIGVK